MRLFTGLALPYTVRRNLELLLEHLRPLAAIHWSPSANLHITTRFIGDWPDARLDELKQALHAMPQTGATFTCDIRGLGWYPNPHHPRVFFAGVAAPPALAGLHQATNAALAPLGLAPEDKPYSPHLTLARIKTAPDLAPLKQAIAALPSVDFGRLDAAKFQLYLSQPGTQASTYSVLEEFPL